MTIVAERTSNYSPPARRVIATYFVTGSRQELIERGLCAESDFPEGSKRTRSRFDNDKERYFGIKKQRGDCWRLHAVDPAEPTAILFELAVRGLQVPAGILAMAWQPGMLEGPSRVAA